MTKILKNKNKGTTFIEILLYISIFLILTPILLSVSVYSMRTHSIHNSEKDISFDSRFVAERMYDLITQARLVDIPSSVMNDDNGKLSLIMHDDDRVEIWLNDVNGKIMIKENGVDSELSSNNAEIARLYFEAIEDNIDNDNIVLGVAIHMGLKRSDEFSAVQDYILSANLEAGDYDGDGCIDALDTAPANAECCGDIDGDGICDEKDNCVKAMNAEQEDSDADGIGNACDETPGGGTTAYNCVDDSFLLDMINETPQSHTSMQLRESLVSSSPLSDTVLAAIITKNSILNDNHFADVFVQNVKLSTSIYTQVLAIPPSQVAAAEIDRTEAAQAAAVNQPVLNAETSSGSYDVSKFSSSQKVKFTNEGIPLGSRSGIVEAEFYDMNIHNPAGNVIVTTHNSAGEATVTVNASNPTALDTLGFETKITKISNFYSYHYNDYDYSFSVTALSHTAPLDWISFDFGSGAQVDEPSTYHHYHTERYTVFCAGGCSVNCGDTGTGILVTFVEKDQCYKWPSETPPAWSKEWYSYMDDNSAYGIGTYLGGRQSGIENLYIEKTFTSVLSDLQKEKLESITIGADVSYQSRSDGICYSNGCPMKGTLVDDQNIELYNWVEGEWQVIGVANVNGATSNQQKFEVLYGPAHPNYATYPPQDFISPTNKISARMEFHWDGSLPYNDSPAVLSIDYLVAHLKWEI